MRRCRCPAGGVTADTDEDGSYSESELQALTRSQILSLAQSLGYTSVKGNMSKTAMITAFLAAQEAAGGGA